MRSTDTIMAEGRVQPKRKRRDPVAPVLTALLEDLRAKVLPGKPGAGDAQVLRLADDELRQFRRLLRAAEGVEVVRVAAAIADREQAHQLRLLLVDRQVKLRQVAHEIRQAAKAARGPP